MTCEDEAIDGYQAIAARSELETLLLWERIAFQFKDGRAQWTACKHSSFFARTGVSEARRAPRRQCAVCRSLKRCHGAHRRAYQTNHQQHTVQRGGERAVTYNSWAFSTVLRSCVSYGTAVSTARQGVQDSADMRSHVQAGVKSAAGRVSCLLLARSGGCQFLQTAHRWTNAVCHGRVRVLRGAAPARGLFFFFCCSFHFQIISPAVSFLLRITTALKYE